MNDCKSILFNPETLLSDVHHAKLQSYSGTDAFNISEERYDDGVFSGWYSVNFTNPAFTSSQIHAAALKCEADPRTFGAVMLRGADGSIDSPKPFKNDFALGALLPKSPKP